LTTLLFLVLNRVFGIFHVRTHTPEFLLYQPMAKLAVGNQDHPTAKK
jgi:hypothetical protein